MKDLRPTYDPNGQKQGKTGNFCKKAVFLAIFIQPTIEHTRRFLSSFVLLATKIPAKITGKFSEPNRELSANNREIVIKKHKPLDFLYLIRYNTRKEINEMEVNYEQVRD